MSGVYEVLLLFVAILSVAYQLLNRALVVSPAFKVCFILFSIVAVGMLLM